MNDSTTKNPFGRFAGGQLRLRGRVCDITGTEAALKPPSWRIDYEEDASLRYNVYYLPMLEDFVRYDAMRDIWGLVVQEIGREESGGRTFQRVGVGFVSERRSRDDGFWKNLLERIGEDKYMEDITLI